MPAWWGRKSHKNTKEVKAAATPEREREQQQQQQHRDYIKASFVNNIDNNNNNNNNKSKEKFDQVSPVLIARNSVRTAKDFGVSCGSDSDGHCGGLVLEKKGHPLPRPSVSSPPPLSLVIDHGIGSGSRSGSVSVSSVSSSGSSEEASPVIGSFGNSSDPRAHVENKLNLRSRSPGPGSRGLTAPTSPLHPLQFCTSLDSSTGKQEDGKTSCHPLPLPPSSPTNRCTSPTVRSIGANENTHCLHSKWKKGKLLGRGTFGHVYVGFNSENGQMCAIKEVKVISDDQTSKECLKQLNQEILLLSQLSHPNIVQYYGSELGEDTLSVYLEYVSGGSIHKLLQEYGPFKEPVIQSYTRQILFGLAYLHGRNTVHRDIKGANILVGPNGEVKLVDFGMAKHITSSSVLSFKGSPYWMAPEVIMNISGYSLAVDIWSLGCTIFEMATSKPPWSQYGGVPAIFKIGNSKDIPEIPDHLSSNAKSFLRLCLQRDPSARPTAAQLMDHPFIRDQAASRVSIINLTNDAPRSSFEGNHTPTNLEFHPNRTNISIPQRDYVATQLASSSRAFKSTSGSIRVNLSLPVSPCSSPLRNYGPAYKSCLLSPPHPTYTCVGQGGYDASPVLTTRAMTGYAVDFSEDLLHPRTLTPSGSPRWRPN